MKLGDWLKRNNMSRAEFARRTGLSKGSISQICNEESAWVSRETAEQIFRETGGAVTPNDFLKICEIKEVAAMSQSVTRRSKPLRAAKSSSSRMTTTARTKAISSAPPRCARLKKWPSSSAIAAASFARQSPQADARRLNLQPMVALNDAPHGTAFTVSVDVSHGLTTGISAEQRSNTVRALANGNIGAGDFVRPGHVFPLIAREGGVLMRSGHTEAAVDLVRLAGLPPVGVICELANDDGTVMAGPQIEAFAKQHKLKRISVADLIAYRQAREKLVERVKTFHVEGPSGPLTGYAYVTRFDPVQHFAFVQGEIGDGRDMPTRLHRADIIADVITGGEGIRKTFACFKKAGRGVFIYLRDGTAGVPVTVAGEQPAESEALRTMAWREVGLGAQILRDLGVSSIQLRTSRPMTFVGLSGFGIEITASEGLE